jgi:hypothetical protein
LNFKYRSVTAVATAAIVVSVSNLKKNLSG